MYEFDDSRLEKLADMREEGVSPYPHNFTVTHTAAEAVEMMGEATTTSKNVLPPSLC